MERGPFSEEHTDKWIEGTIINYYHCVSQICTQHKEHTKEKSTEALE